MHANNVNVNFVKWSFYTFMAIQIQKVWILTLDCMHANVVTNLHIMLITYLSVVLPWYFKYLDTKLGWLDINYGAHTLLS